uniref:LisH domain-containing protein n=1 Tax=Caenorhabditis tropicalis TaxID=1561998 RepID=A0A1I7UXB2_9PELO
MTTKEIWPLRSTETMYILSQRDLKISTTLIAKLNALLTTFDENHTNSNWDPIPLLKEISKMLENATEKFIKNDPDPMDDRHPHRTHPDSLLGNILKLIFKNDDFMTKLVVSYVLARENVELSIQGCRLLLACVPGLDPIVVFSEPDDFVPRLYQYARGKNETLSGYAFCLLASAMENTENTSKYRDENSRLVPWALRKLRELMHRTAEEHKPPPTDFSSLNNPESKKVRFEIPSNPVEDQSKENLNGVQQEPTTSTAAETVTFSEQAPPPKKRRTEPCLSSLQRAEPSKRVPSFHNLANLDDSNSRWDILQPFLIGNEQVYPLSLASYQRFILQFLASCGEYQDLLPQAYEGNALKLLLKYCDLEKSKDIRLTFDALRYLTSLLVHRKVALEFMQMGGIPALLRLPRASLASCAVVTCFYYIAYNNDAVELLCQMSDEELDDAIQYILYCFEHNHESGKSSACMFFAQTLEFKAILTRFDKFDGPRMLYNYVSTLNLMQPTVGISLTEEQVHTSTQVVRAFSATIKSYLIAHIFVKVENYKRQYGNTLPCGLKFPEQMQSECSPTKSMKSYQEISTELETIVLEMLRYTGHTFPEIQNMCTLGMVKVLLGVRVHSREWMNVSAGVRNDMCTNAFEALRMMLCQPSIQLDLIPIHRFSQSAFDGLTILFRTALGRPDDETCLRMAALSCIQRCVYVEPECWKTIIQKMKDEQRQSTTLIAKSKYEQIMNHLETMWTEVRKTDGIMALIELINVTTPLTDADSIRRLATNTLTGLARHPEVRQILTKLPIIAQSGLQILMREPVCSDKRDIHAGFCKEAVQLLQIVHGRKIHDSQAKDLQSSEKSHRQWVVENTKVSVNQVELLQLIHDHLVKNKLDSVAAMLKTEAKLPDRPTRMTNNQSIMNKPLPSTGSNFTKLSNTKETISSPGIHFPNDESISFDRRGDDVCHAHTAT